jgi:hypothetical protein
MINVYINADIYLYICHTYICIYIYEHYACSNCPMKENKEDFLVQIFVYIKTDMYSCLYIFGALCMLKLSKESKQGNFPIDFKYQYIYIYIYIYIYTNMDRIIREYILNKYIHTILIIFNMDVTNYNVCMNMCIFMYK